MPNRANTETPDTRVRLRLGGTASTADCDWPTGCWPLSGPTIGMFKAESSGVAGTSCAEEEPSRPTVGVRFEALEASSNGVASATDGAWTKALEASRDGVAGIDGKAQTDRAGARISLLTSASGVDCVD